MHLNYYYKHQDLVWSFDSRWWFMNNELNTSKLGSTRTPQGPLGVTFALSKSLPYIQLLPLNLVEFPFIKSLIPTSLFYLFNIRILFEEFMGGSFLPFQLPLIVFIISRACFPVVAEAIFSQPASYDCTPWFIQTITCWFFFLCFPDFFRACVDHSSSWTSA